MKEYRYDYLGRIEINRERKIKLEGILSETCMDVMSLRYRLMMYNNHISDKKEELSNILFKEVLEQHKIKEEGEFYGHFQEFVTVFTNRVELFKYTSNYLLKPGEKSKDLLKKDNIRVSVKWNEPEGLFYLNYGFNRDAKSKLPITTQFATFLKKQGTKGKEYAKTVANTSIEEEKQLWSQSSKILGELAWVKMILNCFVTDVFLKQKIKKPHIFALPRETINSGIKRLLQAKEPFITVTERSVDYYKEGDSRRLGCIPMDTKDLPNVQPDLVPIIKAGGKMIGSFMSHKLLHFENKLFYDRWNKGVHDFRKVSVEGGYEAILKHLNYATNGRNIENIKKILCFQASFWFTLPTQDGGSKTGNLITFTEHKNKFGKIGRLDIIAGSMMTPEAVYSASKIDGANLLVPFVKLPEKMVGNPATWGSQAFLQMLVLEYLTMQSRELAQKGSIQITAEKWEQLATEANLDNSSLKRIGDIKTLFCCPDQGFLEIQGNECTFNKKNENAKTHLIEQGKMREKKSQQSKRSRVKKRLK